MKTLDRGKDKIQFICDQLRKETLEPAKLEAASLIEEAEKQAENIVRAAEKNADEIVVEARNCMDREKSVFQSSLKQATKQSLEALRQDVEKNLFNPELFAILEQNLKDKNLLASLITKLIEAIEKEGLSADFSAIISQNASSEELNALLASSIIDRLKEKSVVLGKFAAGAKIELHDQRMTIDISAEALKELFGNYLRKDFRQLIFNL